MTRTSAVFLQVIVIAIFVSSMIFFSLAVSRAHAPQGPLRGTAAMLDMNTFEAMPVPMPREDFDAWIILPAPCEGDEIDEP
jgi:hypothetical protein